MSGPAIIAFGAAHVSDYPEAEFEAALSRAFAGNPGGFVVLDSHPRGQRFLAAAAAWAIERGWLSVDQIADDGQSEVCSLRLTEAGKGALAAKHSGQETSERGNSLMPNETDADSVMQRAEDEFDSIAHRLLAEGGAPLLLSVAALMAGLAIDSADDKNAAASCFAQHVLHIYGLGFDDAPLTSAGAITDGSSSAEQDARIKEMQLPLLVLLGGLVNTQPEPSDVLNAWMGALIAVGAHVCGIDATIRLLRVTAERLPEAARRAEAMLELATTRETGTHDDEKEAIRADLQAAKTSDGATAAPRNVTNGDAHD